MQVGKEQLRAVAAHMVTDGLRRAAALSGEAWEDKRLASMMKGNDALALHGAADGKFQKAERIRRLCMLIGTAHGIGPKKIGRRLQPAAFHPQSGEPGNRNGGRISHEG